MVHESQMGFRTHVVARDVLFPMQGAIKEIPIEPESFSKLFIDFRKAFDFISHNWLIQSLNEHRVPKLISLQIL